MSHAKLSRRAILAGSAAVSATAIAATPTRASWTTPAVVDATAPDPIFAVIEKYRATNTAFIALCHHEESLENAGQADRGARRFPNTGNGRHRDCLGRRTRAAFEYVANVVGKLSRLPRFCASE
jgi:hypothetical protein